MISSWGTNSSSLITWWNGQDYHKNSHSQCKLALEVLQKYPFKGHEIVLDIGCGDGEVTCFIAREKVPFGRVVGIDSSSSMIEIATANQLQRNATFQMGLAESFQINDLFDVIVSFSTLHWVPDQPAVWNNIRRHLKIGGHALISLNPAPRSKELTKAIDKVIQSSQFSPFFRDFAEKSVMPLMSIEQYENVILQAGLKVDECKQSDKYFEYENKEIFVNNVKAWLPHVAQVPKELQNLFVNSIITIFLLNTHQNEIGSVRLDYNNFMIQATRLN